MSTRFQRLRLSIILFATMGVAAVCSHVLVRILGVRTGGMGYKLLAQGNGRPLALAEGSSLMLDGLSWKRISKEIGMGIENWFVAGSSPPEWEWLLARSPEARMTFFVVSAYDLNEDFLCDYRAGVVPLSRSVSDLRECGADWQFFKRVVSLYPREYVRVLFPTVGRSDGVMTGLRDALQKLGGRWTGIESEAGPVIVPQDSNATENIKTEKVTDWPKDRLLRRTALMRAACQGRHTFNGPKKLAFLRMLRSATKQGRTVVAVLPVSPLYTQEFLSPEAMEQFEATLADGQRSAPEALWVRLDEVSDLDSDEYFQDLVHMNSQGQRIATEKFLSALRRSASEK